MYKYTHIQEFSEGNVSGKCRVHGRYDECRENIDLNMEGMI